VVQGQLRAVVLDRLRRVVDGSLVVDLRLGRVDRELTELLEPVLDVAERLGLFLELLVGPPVASPSAFCCSPAPFTAAAYIGSWLISCPMVTPCFFAWSEMVAKAAAASRVLPSETSSASPASMLLKNRRAALTQVALEAVHLPGGLQCGEPGVVDGVDPAAGFAFAPSRIRTFAPWIACAPKMTGQRVVALGLASGCRACCAAGRRAW
jgi:hypothetical protein